MKRRISKLLPPEIKTQVAYAGKKLSTCFNVKDQSKFEHQHDAHTMQIALMKNVEKITLEKVVVELQNAFETFCRIWTCERYTFFLQTIKNSNNHPENL